MRTRNNVSVVKRTGKPRSIRLWGLSMIVPVMVLLLWSCDMSDFGDTNVHPTNVTEVPPGMQFARAQLQTTLNQNQQHRIAGTTGGITQTLAEGGWENYGTGDPGYFMSNPHPYSSRIKQIEDILVRLPEMEAEGEEVGNLFAATRIMRVFIFHQITDLYGDIVYSEAARGFHDQNFFPKYDTQEFVYMDLLNELEEAVAQLDPAQPTYGSNDLIYGGDVGKWRKWGNSLRLRLALRLIKVEPGIAEQHAVAAINGGVMTSNDDIAFIQHVNRQGTTCCDLYGLRHYYVGVERWYNLSSTFTEWLRDRDDPRLSIFGALIIGGNYADGEFLSSDPDDIIGRATGWTDFEMETALRPEFVRARDIATAYDIRDINGDLLVNAAYAKLNPIITPIDGPEFFQTYAQVAFNRAEVAARGWTAEDPAVHYSSGVRAALEQLTMYDTGTPVPLAGIENSASPTIDPAVIDAYVADREAEFAAAGSAEDRIRLINEQYWVATFQDFHEAWANYRRSGYPDLEEHRVGDNELPSNNAVNERPRRMVHDDDNNIANWQEAQDRQGLTGDTDTDIIVPVWWDVD